MLTTKQHELLVFIDKHLRETGCSPSFEEMKEALDLRSKSGIHRLIIGARGARVPAPPQAPRAGAGGDAAVRGSSPPPAREAQRFAPERDPWGFLRQAAGRAGRQCGRGHSLPLYGKIAAGLPIEALNDHSVEIEVPVALIGNGDHFALEVEGDSMIEAGILDGDTVIIRKGETAENGQIIVALIDDKEVTLKRLRRRGNSVALEPANIRYETRIFPAERVKVQGRLVALLRRY